MNINRHNYEEFFLLYVDNELSAAERRSVESFVQQNPDLENELSLLRETVLNPANLVFDAKELLMKNEGISDLQEQLLLYADNELSKTATADVVNLIKKDATVAAEWNILQQTKLPGEHIVFADKQSLYRTEGGRVVGFKLWRVAAAAILLGFGIWTGISVYKNNLKTGANDAGIVSGNKTQSPSISKDPAVNPVSPVTPAENPVPQNAITVATADKKGSSPKETTIQPVEKITPKNIPAEEIIASKRLDNNLPKSYLDNINNDAGNNTAAATVQPKMAGNLTDPNPALSGSVQQPVTTDKTNTETNPYAQNALYTNTEENNNDRFLYMSADKVKKSKLAGLFRKVKRVVERNTNIKTGNGIKVAGFEIAIK